MRNLTNLLLLCLFMVYADAYAHTGKIVQKIKSPGSFPTCIVHDGEFLWVGDRKSDLLYQIDPANGEIYKKIQSPGYWPSGLAWDGQFLWNADLKGGQDIEEDYDGKIYKVDPEDGRILKTMAAPTSCPVGLCWDGTYLWCIDNRADKIIQFSPDDGTTIRSFRAPSGDCRGLTFDGEYLWTTDRNRDEIYRVNPKTGYVILVTDSPGEYPRGICYDGQYLWNVDYQSDIIYKMIYKDDEKLVKTDPRDGKVIYTQQIKNFGPGKVLTADFHVAIPTNSENQFIKKISYNIKPTEFITDQWGQKTAHYRLKNILAGETVTAEMTVSATIYDVRYFIFPEEIGSLDEIPADIKNKYLENNDKFQFDHPVIKEALAAAVGDETNPYWIVRKIFNHIIENMYYEMSGGWNTAPTVLARGNGSCSEYTFVFISMCRAMGIPARYVGSVVSRGDDAMMDDVFHRWAEVYLPNYGWIPVDGSRGDRDWPRDQAMAIGHMYNTLLITTQSGGGSETMEWTYNSNVFYTTEPKTHVNFEHFADWEPAR